MIDGALPAWLTDQTVPVVWFLIALLTNPSRWSGWVTARLNGEDRETLE